MALALSACAPQRNVRVLDLAHGLDTSHPVHRAMEVFAAEVERRSHGELVVRIYPAEQLGSERECLELLQIGSLAITKVSASVLESFVPAMGVLGLPYVFRDRDHRFGVLGSEVGRELLATTTPYRLRGLTFYDAGERSFYTRDRPVRVPADLDGLKIRTQESAIAMSMVRALGGSATPISWGELYTALQQGVVDGAENNPPSFHLSRHYEIARYYSLDEHTAVPDVLIIGTRVWNALDPRERQIVQEAADVSALKQRIFWAAATEEALEAVRAAGVEILRPEKVAFAEKVEPMLAEIEGDPEVGPWLRRIRAWQPAATGEAAGVEPAARAGSARAGSAGPAGSGADPSSGAPPR